MRSDHVPVTKEPPQNFFVTGPRPHPLKGLGAIVLVHTQVQLLCSDLPKQIMPRGETKQSPILLHYTTQVWKCPNIKYCMKFYEIHFQNPVQDTKSKASMSKMKNYNHSGISYTFVGLLYPKLLAATWVEPLSSVPGPIERSKDSKS